MKTILDTLKNGTAKERLAIVADLTSIVGISIASIAGGIFAFGGSVRVTEVIFATVYSLLCLAGAVVVLAFFIYALAAISERLIGKPAIRLLLLVALWSLLLAAALTASVYFYFTISSFVFTK